MPRLEPRDFRCRLCGYEGRDLDDLRSHSLAHLPFRVAARPPHADLEAQHARGRKRRYHAAVDAERARAHMVATETGMLRAAWA